MQALRESAIDGLWLALKGLASHILIDLRETPDDPVAVSQWAERHGLGSACIVAEARDLRRWWTRNPRTAVGPLKIAHVVRAAGTFRTLSAAEEEWLSYCASPEGRLYYFPDPSRESRNAWLARAARLYRERARLIYGDRPMPRRRSRLKPSRMPRHCEWFVQVYLLDVRPATLARREKVHPSAISRETTKVAQLLGLDLETKKAVRTSV